MHGPKVFACPTFTKYIQRAMYTNEKTAAPSYAMRQAHIIFISSKMRIMKKIPYQTTTTAIKSLF